MTSELHWLGRSAAGFVACLVLLAEPVAAQPTQAQQSALRSNCRSDYMANCSSVKPGGIEALQCLQRNVAKLSPGCQSAVNALNPPSPPTQKASAPAMPPPVEVPASAPPAPAAAAPAMTPAPAPHPQPAVHTAPAQPAPPQSTVAHACQSDFRSHCKGVQPGGAAAHQCLQRHAGSLSPGCARALVAAGGGASPAPVAAATPAAVAAPAAAPTADQQSAIKANCRNDFMTNCRGVTPGGREALACLQRNASNLSPACRTSVAALSGGAPAATESTAAAAPAATPMRPVGPLRRALRERMMEQQR